MLNGYKEGLEIDRRKNNGIYEPNNCRWVTRLENLYNRSITIRIKYKGKLRTLGELSFKYNISRPLLYSRIFVRKWNIKKALITPPKKYNINGKNYN